MTRYAIWQRSTMLKHCDRWHRQTVHKTLQDAMHSVTVRERINPHHEFCIIPHAGSFPVTTPEWVRVSGAYVEGLGEP